MSTSLVEIQDAVARFDKVALGIAQLKERYEGVLYPVETPAGMDAAKKARAEIRAPRYELERLRVDAKAPILKLGKALDVRAREINEQILAIETPIDEQIKNEEARKEAERQAKAEAERKRVAAIRDQIELIRSMPLHATGKSVEFVLMSLTEAQEIVIGDGFAEFKETAILARNASVITLQAIYDERVHHEAEQERLRLERIELDRQKAEAAERDRLAAIERNAEAERQRLAREANEALIRKQQQEAHAEIQRQRDEQAQLEAAERIKRVEEDARQQKIRDAEAKKLADDRAAFEAEQAKIRLAKQIEDDTKAEQARLASIQRPSYESIVACIADAYAVPREKAEQWLNEFAAIQWDCERARVANHE